jgi:hypothetical protein
MTEFKSVTDVLKLVDKSNCQQCGYKTCMAFAAAVLQGRANLSDCPRIDPDLLAQHGQAAPERSAAAEEEMMAMLASLKSGVAGLDFEKTAQRLGGRLVNGRLVIKVMGKDVAVDHEGKLHSDIHLHPWISIPVLSYLLYSQGIPLTGEWVTLRELEGGAAWHNFFVHRCVKPLKKVADNYPELFRDLLDIFNGKKAQSRFDADTAILLYPLPLVPVLICYWKPEEGMESSINIFFDSTADKNMGVEFIYRLVAGLVIMFEKIAHRHGAR